MDSRSFTYGLVCGAVVGALGVWMATGGRVEDGADAQLETNKAIDISVGPGTLPIAPEPQRPTNETPSQGSTLEPSPEAPSQQIPRWPDNVRAEFYQEPKDESWAYYMEQTLLQFLGGHRLIGQFDILSLECRTTRCQVEVAGFDASTVPVWQQVMYDVRQQPWSEFGQSGSSSGNVDGRLVIVSTFHRLVEED